MGKFGIVRCGRPRIILVIGRFAVTPLRCLFVWNGRHEMSCFFVAKNGTRAWLVEPARGGREGEGN